MQNSFSLDAERGEYDEVGRMANTLLLTQITVPTTAKDPWAGYCPDRVSCPVA